MSLIEAAATSLGKAVATHAAREWLAVRRERADSGAELSELLALSFRDKFLRRKIELQLKSVAADIAERAERMFEADNAAVPEHEAAAALHVVARTFGPEARTDEALFAVDADPAAMVERLRPALAANAESAGLGDAAERLAGRVLTDCVHCYVQMVRHLPTFTNRAGQETLSRLSRISIDVAEILARQPVPRADGPAPDDGAFIARYLAFVSTHYDQLELFGVDVRNYTAETTLSIAYLSLAVGDLDGARPARRPSHPRGRVRGSFIRSGKDDDHDEQTGLRVEAALGRSRRILVRGEAGSGKSTLLRWLAITAARKGFSGELQDWNGRTPFLVKLRSYADRPLPSVGALLGDDIAQFATEVPAGLVERIFAAGRALLLVDGVDELIRAQRTVVRQWLRRILDRHPDVIVVVTSRPTGASARWLTNDGFLAVMLERMSPADIVEFVRRWHRAIGGARHLPCDPTELPRYERRLLARLDANHHLRGLATNPLMCAMLCALNLDRGDDLPHDRISLYRAALEMLLERRDIARNVPSYQRVGLGAQHAMSLLQDLAWRLTLGNQSELDTGQAREHVRRKLTTMPKVTAEPEDVFEHLLDRSGVLKDVAEDRISFVHRTFQEYLAAQEVAEENYVDVLVEHATRDMWRETVVMTAGLANSEYRQRLVNRLLDRAESSPPRRARWLRLLAGACVETAPALSVRTLDRIDANLAELVPPRSSAEARSLSLAGERILRLLPDDLGTLSEGVAAATVEMVAFVGGPAALRKLGRYGQDTRRRVRDALIQVATHFEPDEYGRLVLADSPLYDGWISADEWTAPMLRHLRHLRDVEILADDPGQAVRNLPRVRTLSLHSRRLPNTDPPIDLDFLRNQPDLEQLISFYPCNPAQLPATMPRLRTLSLWLGGSSTPISELSWVTRFPRLTRLSLQALKRNPRSYRPLAELPELSSLELSSSSAPRFLGNTSFLGRLPALTELQLNGCADPAVLDRIATFQQGLRTLRLMWLKVPTVDLAAIAPPAADPPRPGLLRGAARPPAATGACHPQGARPAQPGSAGRPRTAGRPSGVDRPLPARRPGIGSRAAGRKPPAHGMGNDRTVVPQCRRGADPMALSGRPATISPDSAGRRRSGCP
ncbi:NACHT domain-containing protein [Plantactinospora sp. KLBMP9567]|uniref:NACHT domain-containing protein n=1 Tax=Plantactinospora sp. KLBMP9567 TaxID=3085900 RepID=UPI00298177E4|nr:NACHT domain-containing protein [Plantactinospora sp. KLBMP9567]MDW5322911.1 NACHT domain-containing protein [Plantactinospora sp. KLBMP9567]